MAKNLQLSADWNGYGHKLKKAAPMQYKNYCVEGLVKFSQT